MEGRGLGDGRRRKGGASSGRPEFNTENLPGGAIRIYDAHVESDPWEADMAKFPRFAAPLSPEWRAYFRGIVDYFQLGQGSCPERREDPLQPFRDAKVKPRRRLISIRVDEDLLEITKELARQHGLRSQAVIRLSIQEGLRRAIREGVDDPDPCPCP